MTVLAESVRTWSDRSHRWVAFDLAEEYRNPVLVMTDGEVGHMREKIVLTGYSLGGGLAAYAATKAPWPVRTIVFDPLGLNRRMIGKPGVKAVPCGGTGLLK